MRKSMFIGVASAAGMVMAATPAVATSYEIDLTANVIALASQNVALWDQDDDASNCFASSGYSPLYDGELLGEDDAFDGGFVVTVGSNDFADPDNTATLKGNTLSTGAPASLGGLKVNSTARSVQTSPTLQYLVKLRNPTKKVMTRKVTVSTDLGSDGATNILKDSSGNGTHTNADRWLITADSTSAPFGDPIVTQVLRGKNQSASTSLPDAIDSDDCMAETYSVRVPGGQSRYLLLFAEMHEITAAGKKAAVHDAAKFDSQGKMTGVLKSISPKLYSKIVNWNLKK
jgi:hypothetical protein